MKDFFNEKWTNRFLHNEAVPSFPIIANAHSIQFDLICFCSITRQTSSSKSLKFFTPESENPS